MKNKFLLTALIGTLFCLSTQAQTLSIGFYDDIEEYGDYGSDRYDGSAWECVPMNFYYTNSGTQIIFTKEELSAMAGKCITALRFIPHTEGAYDEYMSDVKVYLSETNRSAFYKNSSTNKYRYFDISKTFCAFDGMIYIDGYTYDYCDGAPIELTFNTPFYYSGNNNLVVTIINDNASATTDGGFYVNFYQTDLTKRAITFSSETKKLGDVLAGDLYSDASGVSVINAPVCQFSYTTMTVPRKTWSSYVPQYDEDLAFVDFEAYQVTSVNGQSAQLTRVNKAKKNTPLIVYGNIMPSVSLAEGTLDNVTGNLLKVSNGTVSGGNNIYALAEKNGTTAFYRVSPSVTIPNGKVYLEIAAGANEVIFFGNNETDAISNIENDMITTDDAWYTLDGQRLNGAPTQHGIYIFNGKKVIK